MTNIGKQFPIDMDFIKNETTLVITFCSLRFKTCKMEIYSSSSSKYTLIMLKHHVKLIMFQLSI